MGNSNRKSVLTGGSMEINIRDLILNVLENEGYMCELTSEGIIDMVDEFIYVPNNKVRFRRVDRNSDFYRPLNLVSEKEIFDAIYEIIDYKLTLNKETIIKMILLSLGYKKANKAKYEFVENKIDYLLEKKVIFIEHNILYRNI